MDIEKYTDRMKGFIQSSQNLALGEGHQQFLPEHILKVLLDDEEGLCAGLIEKAGGDGSVARNEVAKTLKSQPAISGGDGQLYLSPELAKVMQAAEKVAKKAGDSFVTVERVLLGMALESGTGVGKTLKKAGVTPQNIKFCN